MEGDSQKDRHVATDTKAASQYLPRRRKLLRLLETVVPTGQSESARSSSDSTLTALAQLGALRFNAKRCMISLIDRQTQHVIAEATRTISLQDQAVHDAGDGLWMGVQTLPSGAGLCGTTMTLANASMATIGKPINEENDDHASPLIVNDLSKDDRFKEKPFVKGSPFCRYYAGAPMFSTDFGTAVGSYCILDDKPREDLDPSLNQFLRDMAKTTMSHLDMKRAQLDKARSEKMVRGMGAFVEGESSLREWWSRTRPHAGRKVTKARGRAEYGSAFQTKTSPKPPAARMPSRGKTEHTRTGSGPGSSASAAEDPRQTPVEDLLLPSGTQTLLSRACNILREATELDGVLLLDARTTSLRNGGERPTLKEPQGTSGRSASESEGPGAFSEDTSSTCQILGASTDEKAETDMDDYNPATSLDPFNETFLRLLLRRYPRGHIFRADELSGSSESEYSEKSLDDEAGGHASLDDDHELVMKKRQAQRATLKADKAAILGKAFPGAHSIAFFPLWESQRERWFAGAFAYTCSPLRELTIEDELSYLAAFGNSIMSEIGRIETLRSDKAKTDFISSISHELRSPLHGILGSTELLRESFVELQHNDLLQNVETCGRTLLDTVDHLLDFTKINSFLRSKSKKGKPFREDVPGRSKQLASDLDLNILCEEVLDTMYAGFTASKRLPVSNETVSAAATTHPIALCLDIDDPDRSLVHCEPGALKRALCNVVGNSLKYTDHGFVHFKLSINRSHMHKEYQEIIFLVSDSGRGISKQYLADRLYLPFAQEDPHSVGTGLGLSIVKQILSSLGGSISVQSEEGIGTEVRISLKLPKATNASESAFRSMREDIGRAQTVCSGKTAVFIGFDGQTAGGCEASRSPVTDSIREGNAMLGRSLRQCCEVSFKLNTSDDLQNSQADVIVVPLAEADRDFEALCRHQKPMLVVCPDSRSSMAFESRHRDPAIRLFCTFQPVGPTRMAAALLQCLEQPQLTDGDLSQPPQTPSAEEEDHIDLQKAPNRPPKRRTQSVSSIEPDSSQAMLSLAALRHVEIPQAPGLNEEGSKSKGVPSQRGPHVLLVDDNDINLRLLQTFSKRLGIPSVPARNGLEALEAYKAAWNTPKPFRYVLLDLSMPVMDGFEACREIRQFEREQNAAKRKETVRRASQDATLADQFSEEHGDETKARIIALTGLNSAASQQEAFASGMDLFLTKPVKFQELKKLVLENSSDP